MNIGDKINFTEDGEIKTGTIIWIAIETVFVKTEMGETKQVAKAQIKQQ